MDLNVINGDKIMRREVLDEGYVVITDKNDRVKTLKIKEVGTLMLNLDLIKYMEFRENLDNE